MELHGHYNLWLVAASYLIACIGSYTALVLARDRSVSPSIEPAPFTAILRSAAALGFGIWAMHFTGMAAFHMDGMVIGYRLDLTIVSLLVAIVFTGLGFATLVLLQDLPEAFALAGLAMGCGILTMHFLGMAAMTGPIEQHYHAGLVIVAGVIAAGASTVALWLTMRPHKLVQSVIASMVMGAAICGMHYTGMEAATFTVPATSIP